MSPQNAETPGSQVERPGNPAANPPATSVSTNIVGSALLPADFGRQFETNASPSGPSPVAVRRSLRATRLLANRELEGLRLYEALPKALEFHKSPFRERLLVGSNRSSKTLSAAAEFAWFVTGTHPYNKQYPRENAICYGVGKDFDHVGDVMWRKLARPGAFRVIRDEHTKRWRPFVPDNEYDREYREKARDAGPLLPPRWIKGKIGWEEKNKDIPAVVHLINGTTIRWFSSISDPQQGTAIHCAWLDEEIGKNRESATRWLPEVEARLVDYDGWLWWSFTPEKATQQAYEMYLKSTDPRIEKRTVQSFHLHIRENKYLSKESVEGFRGKLRTNAEVLAKFEGQFAIRQQLVYPEYSGGDCGASLHLIDPIEIPSNWTKYMFVDPGAHVCAVVFLAVPPPGDGDWGMTRHVYGELYLQRCSAAIFAREVKNFLGNDAKGGIEAFVIDHRMGRQTQMGTGMTVEQHYSDALQELGIYSRSTRHAFWPGNDNVPAREEALRKWLALSVVSGKPTVLIHKRCIWLDWELQRQFYKPNTGGPLRRLDENNHAVWGLEAAADLDPAWVPVKKRSRSESAVVKFVEASKRRDRLNRLRA